MLDNAYTPKYTEIFNAEFSAAIRYIAEKLRNPVAAARLINQTEDAIQERLFAPESFEPIPITRNREHPYYKIHVGHYVILYCVIDDIMDIRRFVYDPSDWRRTL